MLTKIVALTHLFLPIKLPGPVARYHKFSQPVPIMPEWSPCLLIFEPVHVPVQTLHPHILDLTLKLAETPAQPLGNATKYTVQMLQI